MHSLFQKPVFNSKTKKKKKKKKMIRQKSNRKCLGENPCFKMLKFTCQKICKYVLLSEII